MSITTYSQLQTAVEEWLNRSDLTAVIPDFISLAEADIRRRSRVEIAFTPLSVGNPTSTLLTEAPDVYLYGTLLQSAPYLEHDERIQIWEQRYLQAMEEYNQYKRRKATPSALTSRAGLESTVDNWLGSYDLTARVPEFVDLALAQIARELRASVTRANLTINAQTVAVPAGVAEVRFLSLTDGSNRIRHLEPATPEILVRFEHTTAGCPTHYRVYDGQIRFNRVPDQTYTGEILSFDQPSLVVDIVANPDLYLYASLLQAAPWLGQDARVPLWGARYREALEAANTVRQQAETGMQLMEMRLPVVF